MSPAALLQTLDDAEAMLRLVARHEFPGALYLVLADRCPPAIQPPDSWGGYVHAKLDVALQETLGDSWRGRGPAMVIQPSPGGSDADARAATLAYVLHEAAHLLEWQAPFDPEDSEPSGHRAIQSGFAAIGTMPDSIRDRWTRAIHGPEFFRVLAHLVHRVRRTPYCPDESAVIGVPGGTRPVRDYIAALGSEPADFVGRPFRELRTLPIPPALAELWQADFGPPATGERQ